MPPIPQRPIVDFKPNVPIDFDELIESHWGLEWQDICEHIAEDLSETEARRWEWDASDDLAIRNGCRFSLRRAMHYAYTLRNYMRLWEGDWEGEPFILRTWQVECELRTFGWVRPSERFPGEWVRRFSKSCKWLTGKSGKSPAAGASAVYLWMFDGRWKDQFVPTVRGGQHVFCMAKNGQQAGLVWNHASTTVDMSPYLSDLLDRKIIRRDLNKSLLRYVSKNSRLTIIAGDSQRSYDAAEGKNANGIQADEAHVIDNRLVTATRKAGKSNESFLWNQNSTYGAGDGYGKTNLEYGLKVASGEIKNDAFLFKAYAARPDATDEECGKESVWIDANPNYGFTVTKRSMREEYIEVKDDPILFSGFKQRALNIWQTSSHPMLNKYQWDAGAEPGLSYDSLKGVGGGVAFDLAVTNDFASVAVAWDESEKLNCWAKIWTCEKWVEDNGWRGDFEQWAKGNQLTVCEGAAIDIYEEVPDFIEKLIRHTKAAALGYDIKFGEATAQRLLKRFPRLKQGKFNQSLASYSVGTHEFRNAVKNGTLRHPDNACLNWMAGHVMAKAMGVFLKPVKPQSDGNDIEWAKVDAIQAICMAITAKTLHPSSPQTDSVASYEVSDDDMQDMDEFWNDVEA